MDICDDYDSFFDVDSQKPRTLLLFPRSFTQVHKSVCLYLLFFFLTNNQLFGFVDVEKLKFFSTM